MVGGEFMSLQELADEKGFFVFGWDLPKDTKEYDYLYMCLLQKWLRDEHGIHISVDFDSNAHTFRFFLYYQRKQHPSYFVTYRDFEIFANYQEALQKALTLALNEIE